MRTLLRPLRSSVAVLGQRLPALPLPPLLLLVCVSAFFACGGPSQHPRRSFDQIRELAAGKTEAEVEALLGKPDTRDKILAVNERWVWWDYAYLDGNQYAPEVRGRPVHLEITFESPGSLGGGPPPPSSEWRATGPGAISYSLPERGA